MVRSSLHCSSAAVDLRLHAVEAAWRSLERSPSSPHRSAQMGAVSNVMIGAAQHRYRLAQPAPGFRSHITAMPHAGDGCRSSLTSRTGKCSRHRSPRFRQPVPWAASSAVPHGSFTGGQQPRPGSPRRRWVGAAVTSRSSVRRPACGHDQPPGDNRQSSRRRSRQYGLRRRSQLLHWLVSGSAVVFRASAWLPGPGGRSSTI